MTAIPDWIQPGATATLIWHSGALERPDGLRLYAVSGPALEAPPPSPYFLLAPAEQDEFAERLYRGHVALADLRRFLERCVLAEGQLVDDGEFVATRQEAPVLPLLEAWRSAAGRPLLPYLADINAFFPGAAPLFVGPDAYAQAQQSPEAFATAWVCEECGEAEDAAVFLWTARAEGRIRVCFLIENDAGVWSCRLHPFEFAREAA